MKAVARQGVRCSLFGGCSFHLEGNNGLIVKGLDAFGMGGNSGEYRVHQLLGAAMCLFADDLLEAVATEQLTLGTGSVKNSIAEEEEDVPRLPAEVELLI